MTWNDLLLAKLEGKEFKTWSVSGKSRDIAFHIGEVDEEGIEIRKQNGKVQKARRVEIDLVLENWEKYKRHEVERSQLALHSFNTSYLFGILKGLEDLRTAA